MRYWVEFWGELKRDLFLNPRFWAGLVMIWAGIAMASLSWFPGLLVCIVGWTLYWKFLGGYHR